MADEKRASDGWLLTVAAGAILVSFYLFGLGWRGLPLPREALTSVDHIGPLNADMPLVDEGVGRNRGGYRTQLIPLAPAGQPAKTYAPARTLWISDTDSIRFGQSLRFLVDPEARLIYEAQTLGRTLLSYDETADNLASSARTRMLAAMGIFAFGGWQAGQVLLRRRRRR